MHSLDKAALFDHSPNPYMVLDRALRYVAANAAYLQATSSRLEDLLGRTVFEAFPNDPAEPDNASARLLRESLERVLARRTSDVIALVPYRVPAEDGTLREFFWSATHTPILDDAGEVAFILQHTVNVTELQELKAALHEARASRVPDEQIGAGVLRRARQVQDENVLLDRERLHLRRLFEQAPGFMVFLRGRDHVFELANRAYLELIGQRDLTGMTAREALAEVEGQGFFELLDRVFATGRPFVGRDMAVRLQREPGMPLEERITDFVYQPIVAADGSVAGIFVQGHDMTERHRAEAELARYRDHLEQLVAERTRELEASEAERQQAEAALRQSQKMEAIGKLTGGVAHDFNNLLQIISGNLQLLQHEVGGNDRARRRIETAASAVDRGARLASQLLAFARRQPLEPMVINLARLLRGMDELLRRALGDDIEIETVIGGGLWNTLADPTQIENVILNLAINARDAMGGSGKLTIEAGNAMLDDHYAAAHAEVTPGQYVQLAISDTGCGIPPEIVDRVIEPFFTTKPEGRGTGLGLSMVYGFVKQSGGHLKIYSEVGHGTTVKIYLPRAMQAELPRSEALAGPVAGGTETILVVEDDADVRKTVVELLAGLGYQVLRAHDGQSALSVLQSGVHVDLLFTDVVMPGPVRSPDLARRAKELLPDLEVLFTSGYTENAIVHGGRLDPGVSLLSKPYRREDLARKIRHLLQNREQRRLAAANDPVQPPPRTESAAPLRILLVEDDAGIRESAADILADHLGHQPTSVESAEEAERVLAEADIDVLLTDVGLPGISGLELARRAVRERPSLGVIIASGYGAAIAPGNDVEVPGAVLLPKPYGPAQLAEALRQIAVRRG